MSSPSDNSEASKASEEGERPEAEGAKAPGAETSEARHEESQSEEMATNSKLPDSGSHRPLDADFYRCPNTGELVYRWSDERMVLVTSDNARTLRAAPEPPEGLEEARRRAWVAAHKTHCSCGVSADDPEIYVDNADRRAVDVALDAAGLPSLLLERDQAVWNVEAARQDLEVVEAERDALRVRAEEAERALGRYGKHENGCQLALWEDGASEEFWLGESPPCSCGLAALLDRMEAAGEECWDGCRFPNAHTKRGATGDGGEA